MATQNQIDSPGASSLATLNILSNITGAPATPIGNTLTAIIDACIGSTQGDILYRNGTVWTVLAPGTSGTFLQTQGASANPQWVAQSSVSPSKFSASTAGHATVTGDGTNYLCILESASQNTGSNYNTSTGLYTAPSTAFYHFSASLAASGITAAQTGMNVWFQQSGSQSVSYYISDIEVTNIGVSGEIIISGSINLPLTASDTISLNVLVNGTGKLVNLAAQSLFSGYLVL